MGVAVGDMCAGADVTVIGTRQTVRVEVAALLVPKGTVHLSDEVAVISNEARGVNVEPAINGVKVKLLLHVIARVEIGHLLTVAVWREIDGEAVAAAIVSRVTVIQLQQGRVTRVNGGAIAGVCRGTA